MILPVLISVSPLQIHSCCRKIAPDFFFERETNENAKDESKLNNLLDGKFNRICQKVCFKD